MESMNVKGNCRGGGFEDDRRGVEGIEAGGVDDSQGCWTCWEGKR